MVKKLIYRSYVFFHRISLWFTRRFTPAGWLVLAGLGASAVVGLDTTLTTAHMAFTLLLALCLTSLLWGFLFRARFRVRRKLPRFGSAGEPLAYRIEVENRTGKPQRGLLLRENLEDPTPSFGTFFGTPEPQEQKRNLFDRRLLYYRWMWLLGATQKARVKEQPLPAIPAGGIREIRTEILPYRRGNIRFESLSLSCPDPFGLFKARIDLPAPQTLLILPKRYPLPPFQLPGTRRYQPGGVALASSVGDSEEFLSLRDYRPGDPLRRIHWKSWARTGKPIVKEYQNEFFVRHALILDTFQEGAYSEAFEEAVSVAASFVYALQTRESLLDLMFVGTEAFCFTSGRGISQVDRMLEILASVSPCKDMGVDALMPLVLERTPALSGCICVLLAWDEARQALIRLLKGLGVPVSVLVIGPSEKKEKLDPGPMKGDPGRLHVLTVGKIQEGLAGL